MISIAVISFLTLTNEAISFSFPPYIFGKYLYPQLNSRCPAKRSLIYSLASPVFPISRGVVVSVVREWSCGHSRRPSIYPRRYSNQSRNIFNLFQYPYLSRRRCWINLGRPPSPRAPHRKLNELSPSKCTFFTSELARPIDESPVFFIEKAIVRSVRLSVF